MDCSNARILLLFSRPGRAELAPDDSEALSEHLGHCAECRLAARKEKQVDDVLGRAMRDVPIPAGLQERIQVRLAYARRPRPWVWLSAAAALLLVAGLGVAWYVQAPPSLSGREFVKRGSPDEMIAWFHERGLAVEMPGEFDPQYLDSWEVAEVAGRRVPKLLFICRGAVAHVYVIPTSQFEVDREGFVSTLADNSLTSTVEDPVNGLRFVVIYTSGSRDSFPRRSGV